MTTTPEVMPLTSTLPTATTHTATTADDLISAPAPGPRLPRVARPGPGHRRLRRTHPPVRQSSQILDRDGAVLLERAGTVLAPCGNRRAAVCPACSDRYAADAFHLLRAGLAGDDTKDVPDTVTDHPRVFLTLTAPSFGPVHTRTVTRRGHVIPCRCGDRHHPDDPRLGTALDPDTYDYAGAVLWQAHAGQLWARFTIALRRALAAALGVPGRDFPRPRPALLRQGRRVPAPRARALPRRHPPRRTRRTHRPTTGRARPSTRSATPSPPPPAPPRSPRTGPDGTPLVLGWGAQLDLRPVTATAAAQLEDDARARSPTPRSPATSPSTPPSAPAPSTRRGRRPARSATASTSPTSTSPRTTAA